MAMSDFGGGGGGMSRSASGGSRRQSLHQQRRPPATAPSAPPSAPQHKQNNHSISIEISIKSENPNDDLVGGAGHTRGPSLSFPNEYLGFARRVSSGILKILQSIDAEPECAICMDDLDYANGDDHLGIHLW